MRCRGLCGIQPTKLVEIETRKEGKKKVLNLPSSAACANKI